MMTPQSQDWNRFWSKRSTAQCASPSWSKQRILTAINPFLSKGKKILDAGCGSGFFSKYFCDQGLKTVSLDYSDSALEMAKKMTSGRAEIFKGDLLSDYITIDLGRSFDIIFSDGLLEHFSETNQDKIMQNFKALLTKDGMLITFVPNFFSPWEIIRPLFMPGIDETPFILTGLVRLKKRNGFEILTSGGVNTLPFAFSPDRIFGRYFGMLLYTIARKNG